MNVRRSETMQAKCSCCPYGFHIARDFINFSDSLYSSDSLNNLHKINRDAKPRRQSFDKQFSDPPSLDTSREQTTSPQLIPKVPARRGRYKTETEVYLHVPRVNGIPVTESRPSNSHPVLLKEEVFDDEITSDKLKILWSNFLPSNDLNANESQNPALKRLKQQMAATITRMKQLEKDSNTISALKQKCQMLQEENRQLHQQPRKKALHSRSIGVGTDEQDWDISLSDRYSTNQQKTLIERESHSNERVRIKEKEIHTILTGKNYTTPEYFKARKPATRTVAVETDKNDEDTQIRIHEKELRTVLIGGKLGGGGQSVQRRNVGVLCKSAMRDVGVSYMCDWKADTRTVGVGVGEQLGQILEGRLDLSELTKPADHLGTSTSYTTIQQTNLAAFYSKVVNINYDAFRTMLEEKFRKDVRTVAIQVKAVETCNRGINHNSSAYGVSIGVGNDSVHVRVQPIVQTKSVGLSICPSTRNSVVQTGTRFLLDSSTNTPRALGVDKGTNPSLPDTYPASTNTDTIRRISASIQTDIKSAKNSNKSRNIGCNTERSYYVNKKTNTDRSNDDEKSGLSFFSSSSSYSSSSPPSSPQTISRQQKLLKKDKAIVTEKIRTYNASTATIMPTVSRSCSTDRKLVTHTGTNPARVFTYDKTVNVQFDNIIQTDNPNRYKRPLKNESTQVEYEDIVDEGGEEEVDDDDLNEAVYSNMAPDVQYGEEQSSLQNIMDDFEELEKKAAEEVFLSNLPIRKRNKEADTSSQEREYEKSDEYEEDDEEEEEENLEEEPVIRKRLERLDVYSHTPDDTGDECNAPSSSTPIQNSKLKSIMKNTGVTSEPRNKAIKFAEK